jgi:glyoxylase-like metal-dependent hydrolase (beta-lactamase superfamily II)
VDTGLAKIAIDVPRAIPGATHVVTHAHADHTGAARKTPVITTIGTHEIMRVLGYTTLSRCTKALSASLAVRSFTSSLRATFQVQHRW